MDKTRWFLVQTLAKWLILVLGSDVFVCGCPMLFAPNDHGVALALRFAGPFILSAQGKP